MNCVDLITSLEKISEANKLMVHSEQKEELEYDISRSIDTILSWMAHLLQGVKQNEAKLPFGH